MNHNIVCKPAETLHKKTCNQTGTNGCASMIGNGNTITYGTLVNGTPKAGDAYDCKVTQDGDYSERLYYVKNIGVTSLLVYYKNINDQITYSYDSSNQKYHGPRSAYQYLPSTSEWNNPKIIAPGTNCAYVYDSNSNLKTYVDNYKTYLEGKGARIKSARLLRIEEILELGCGQTGWNCNNAPAFVIETSYWIGSAVNSNSIWLISSRTDNDNIGYGPNNSNNYGVRPVIII